MAGQSINDRLTAARYSLAGQGLAKSVCKATTEEVIGPKKKHLDYLIQCTNEPNVSIPQLANLLIERSQSQSWVVVFKALITVHHMMCYGNERFTQYLASSNCNFNLGGFLDKTGNADQPQLSYDMSTFIRRYAKYINEKAISYRGVALDFCKTKRGKDDGTLRVMGTDQLLKTLPILQAQVDALLDFDCTASELNNGVISSAFFLLFRDLIRLFACYNDGIINLLEKYFEMNKKQARDALDCYKKFLIRMDRVSEFLKVAEAMGMDKSEIPDLKQAPSSLLDALEAHLASLEGKKVPTGTTATSNVNLKNAVSMLNSTSSSFGLACSNGRVETASPATNGSTFDELTKRAALAEEEALYEKLKTEKIGKNNPFVSSPSNESAPPVTASAAPAPTSSNTQILDLFGSTQTEAAPSQTSSKASDDLLQLGNPFASVPAAAPPPMQPPMQQPVTQLYTNGFSSAPTFVTDNVFDAVFGNVNGSGTQTAPGGAEEPNPFSDIGGGQPDVGVAIPAVSETTKSSAFDGYGDILRPEGSNKSLASSAPAPQPSPTPQKLISNDLDMSLSSLVDNLNIKGPPQKQQWSSPKAQSKTGGAGWSQPNYPATGGFRPVGPAMGQAPVPMNQPQWGAAPQPNQPFQQPMQPGMMGQPNIMGQQPTPAPQTGPPANFDPFGALQ